MDVLSKRMAKICGVYETTGDENIKDNRIYCQYTTMKPTGSLLNSKASDKNHPRFAVHFDDGMTIIMETVKGELVYENMLSVGPDTYFLKKGKWPKKLFLLLLENSISF